MAKPKVRPRNHMARSLRDGSCKPRVVPSKKGRAGCPHSAAGEGRKKAKDKLRKELREL